MPNALYNWLQPYSHVFYSKYEKKLIFFLLYLIFHHNLFNEKEIELKFENTNSAS